MLCLISSSMGRYGLAKQDQSRGPASLPEGRQTPQGRNREAAALRGKLCSDRLELRVSFMEGGFRFKSKLKTTPQQTNVSCM